MARLSRRTIAKVQTWVDKQKTPKLRKLLVDGWVFQYDAGDIENMSDEDVRDTFMADIKSDDDQIATILGDIGIEVEYTDDDDDDDEDEADPDEEE